LAISLSYTTPLLKSHCQVNVRLRYLPLAAAAAAPTAVERRVSASEGVDWANLGRQLGGAAEQADEFELCCFVTVKVRLPHRVSYRLTHSYCVSPHRVSH
jgi:hypothetical protein